MPAITTDNNGDEQGPRIFCTACQMWIVGLEQRRAHYCSDFHLVNLKRKIAGLGPLTQPEYQERLVLLAEKKKLDAEKAAEAIPGKKRNRKNRPKFVCEICRKTFSSQQAYMNHLKSKRHLEALKRHKAMSEISSSNTMDSLRVDEDEKEEEEEEEVEETNNEQEYTWIDEDGENDDVDKELERRMNEWDDSNAHRQSPFDDYIGKTAKHTLQYMMKHNGFLVPYIEYLKDFDGLLRYLNQKVCIGYTCIGCDKSFSSIEDVRRHMMDTGHRRMTADEDLFHEEYDEFYDWTNPSSKPLSIYTNLDDEEEEEEEWTEISAEDEHQLIEQSSDVTNSQVIVVPSTSDEVHDGRPKGRLDLNNTTDENDENGGDVNEDVYALALGSKVIGHRSLVRYYKQSGGSKVDMRDAVVAGRSAAEMRVAAWKAEQKRINQVQAGGQAFAKRRQQYFELAVGQSNYYVRKSRFRQNMVVLNSGYRA